MFVLNNTIYLPEANSPQLVHKPTKLMVAFTSLMIELVNATIKFGIAPLGFAHEFAPKF
jgi:hypothetical protein